MIPIKDNVPTDRLPLVTVALILANVVVYLLSIRHGGSLISGPDNQEVVKYGAIPYSITHGTSVAGGIPWYESIFTSMFIHASIIQLAVNMLFLWIFGNNVEDSMGPVKFVIFYLLAGLSADALQIVFSLNSEVPSIGASGAIAGILGGYLILFPRARVVTLVFIIFFFTILELPAILFLGIWIIQQAVFAYFDLFQPQGGGGVAYFAHLGGAAFGLLTIRLFARRRRQSVGVA